MNEDLEVLTTPEQQLRPQHTALLLIDMLNDFLHPEGKTATRAGRPLEFAHRVIPNIARLAEAARDAGCTVVHVQHTTLADGSSHSGPWLEARSRARYSVTDVCVEGTWGHQIIDELSPAASDVIVQKYRYSGFAGTRLDLVLRSRGIRTVVCAGVSTNACVEATAREAFSLDYYTVYPEDGCASWDERLHEATLDSARARYAMVLTVDEIAAALTREAA